MEVNLSFSCVALLAALLLCPLDGRADGSFLADCPPVDTSSEDIVSQVFIEEPTGGLSPEFVFPKGYLPSLWTPIERPARAGSFAIHMETGEPIPDYGSTLPQEYEHFSMLIYYRPTLGERVGLLEIFFGTLGVASWRSSPDSITLYPKQELAKGFTLVDASEHAVSNTEVGIRYDRGKGILGPEYLTCSEVGSVPNPSCSFHLYERNFQMKLSFNRSELHRLARIEELARKFMSCALQRGSTK